MVDYLFHLEIDEVWKNKFEINGEFHDELVMAILEKVAPWYTDFANYIVFGVVSNDLNFHQNKNFLITQNDTIRWTLPL